MDSGAASARIPPVSQKGCQVERSPSELARFSKYNPLAGPWKIRPLVSWPHCYPLRTITGRTTVLLVLPRIEQNRVQDQLFVGNLDASTVANRIGKPMASHVVEDAGFLQPVF